MTQQFRQIDLELLPEHVPYARTVVSSDGCEVRTVQRIGNRLRIVIDQRATSHGVNGVCTQHVHTEIEDSAAVDYTELYDRVDAIADNDMSPPYVEWDGYEHVLENKSDFARRCAYMEWSDCMQHFRASRGIIPDRSARILLNQKTVGDTRKYLAAHGASKQVAAEMEALQARKLLAKLVAWYRDGWNWYYVSLDYFRNGKRYAATCGGYLGLDDVNGYGRAAIVDEVSYLLEQDGYVVVNRPDSYEEKLRNAKTRFAHNLNSQSWID